jgi:chemotaxis protein MotB
MNDRNAQQEKPRPIIIRKTTSGHGGHHGGAWKVAYADFVTAMMAFFMVMWIMGMDPTTKDSIQGYFQNPVGFKKGFGAGQNPLSSGNAVKHQGARTVAIAPREFQRARFQAAAEQIRARLAADAELKSLTGNFEITVTNEGLRIEMTDAGSGEMFFALGSAVPRPLAVRALTIIGEELAGIHNPVITEGHTDARQYGGPNYTNWELSVDRANAARRVLIGAGVMGERVDEVRGHADRQLRYPDRPLDPANRRVSILLPFEGEESTVPGPGSLPIPSSPAASSGAAAASSPGSNTSASHD